MDYDTYSDITNNEAIGRRLRKQRLTLQLTQEQLAEKAGISFSFLGHIERGTRIASVETLARLSKALELDMHYIVFGHSSGYSARSGEMELLQDLRGLLNRY